MKENEIKVGCEIVCQACGWAIVEEVFEDGCFVMDQDGGDHEIDFGNILAVTHTP